MKPDTWAALGARFQQAWQQHSPSEWPTAGRRAFTAFVAAAVCLGVLVLADAPGRWQSWHERAQQRQALLDQRAQCAQDIVRWRAQAAAAVVAPAMAPQALLQAWTVAAAQTGWVATSPQILAEADGGWTVQLHLQGRFADWPSWWERWQDRAATATLQRWHIRSLASPHNAAQVRMAWEAHLASPADEGMTRGPDATTDPFDARAWAQHHWQAAQTDARVAAWLPRWQRAPVVLTQARDAEVHYLGHLQSATRAVALVRVAAPAQASPGEPAPPTGTVHGVALGDALGPELGQVVQIDDERLVVQRWRRDAGGVWRAHRAVWTRTDATPSPPGPQP